MRPTESYFIAFYPNVTKVNLYPSLTEASFVYQPNVKIPMTYQDKMKQCRGALNWFLHNYYIVQSCETVSAGWMISTKPQDKLNHMSHHWFNHTTEHRRPTKTQFSIVKCGFECIKQFLTCNRPICLHHYCENFVALYNSSHHYRMLSR